MGHLMERTMRLAAGLEAKRHTRTTVDALGYTTIPDWFKDQKVVNEYVNRLYDMTLASPKQAHVLCQVHVK